MAATTAASVGVKAPARKPPRMMTGAARPQPASLSDFQNGGRTSSAPPPQWLRRANHKAGIISENPASRPGTMPPANRAGTDACGTSTE